MNVQQQNSDESWSDAEPLPIQGWKARIEQWAWNNGFTRLAVVMAKWDERGLGR